MTAPPPPPDFLVLDLVPSVWSSDSVIQFHSGWFGFLQVS
jgi:hypothetical protein